MKPMEDLTILVAEDDSSLMSVYEKALSGEGYKLILVNSCERALAELYEKQADLLITDLQMAEMKGFEMFPLLTRNHPQMPVIVVSGTYQGLMKDFQDRGFGNVKAFFLKPLSMKVLKESVREVLKIEEEWDSTKSEMVCKKS